MPDGSELRAPEERVPHDVSVRANVALVFIKPHAHTPACIEFVRSELAKKLYILGESDLQEITDELVDKHYAEISKHAACVPPEVKKDAFQDKFGVAWEACEVATPSEAAAKLGTDEPLSSKDLFHQWQTCDKVKVCSGAYVGRIKAGDEDDENLFVVNGFYPYLREKFTAGTIRLFVVAFDPKVVTWAQFRSEIIGATNPATASASSLRAQILANYETLGLKEPPDNTDNGVHGSAGPLEALKERMLWLGFSLDTDPTAVKLTELAVWDPSRHHILENLLTNPVIDNTPIFDLTEDKDTPEVAILVNKLAFNDVLSAL